MKKILCIILLLNFLLTAKAQITTSFPKEKTEYLKASEAFMKGNKLENCIKVSDEFSAAVKSGLISDAMLTKVIETTNNMAARVMSAHPYFYNYYSAVLGMAKSKKSAEEFNQWSEMCNHVIKYQKKGDNKNFERFAAFSNAFYNQNFIYSSNSKDWFTDAKTYTYKTDGDYVLMQFNQCNLIGVAGKDTVTIYRTNGIYDVINGVWKGTGGNVNWSRVGLSPSNVYANIKTPYQINFIEFVYKIDTVEFFHKDYFGATPLYGLYTEKLIPSGDSTASYPRFASYKDDYFIKDITPNVNYTGGFSLHGGKVIGGSNSNGFAVLDFYQKDGKTKIITAYSPYVSIKKGEDIGSPKTQVLIFNGKDTIYHPELTLTYKAKKRELRLLKSETAQGQAKFIDTYHNHEFTTDAIFWNLDSSRMILKTLEGKGQNGSTIESNNYFSKEAMRQIQGLSPYDPLSKLRMFAEKKQSKFFSADEFAKFIDPKLSETQAKALYYDLVGLGFIKYDEPNGIIYMRDKVENFVLANSRKRDFDILRIKSIPADGNDYIDLKTNNIELKGVKVVPISDTAGVVIFPQDKFLKIQKDRDMEFDGLIYGGRMDFFGKEYKFKYAPFTIDLNNLDSMRINIPDGDKLDANNQPKLLTLKTNIEGVKGLLEVDAPINKSGRARLLQFPKLTSKDKSRASYDDPAIANGAYKRDKFYFEIDPFKIDSLNTFTPSVINWSGRLKSGGIFADYPEKLKIQPDLSLGFVSETPPTGLATYGTTGTYKGGLTLNYQGLNGNGTMTHYTSTLISDKISFYPDSTKAVTSSFNIAKTADGVKTPEVKTDKALVLWEPKKDRMQINNLDSSAFSMYDGQTSMKGGLVLSGKGLRGNGALDWQEALIKSKDFDFKTDVMNSDTAEMNIKSIAGDKVTFKTPNVKAMVDFKNKMGDFKSNLPNNPTDFAHNQYKTDLSEFKWDMDKKILDFKSPAGKEGAVFTSLRKSQLGLNFIAKRATYNLVTSELKIEQIKEIRVADALVMPDSATVIIRGEAVMDPLTKAVILVDSATKRHTITNCNLDIISKAELKGNGDFNFPVKEHPKQPIKFNDISCKKETIQGEKKKDITEEYSLVAKGNIGTDQNFFIYPTVNYDGDVTLFGKNKDLFFKGFATVNFKNKNLMTGGFGIIDDVNPDTLWLHIDTTTRGKESNHAIAGIFIEKDFDVSNMYTTLLGGIKSVGDKEVFRATGVLTHDAKNNEYLIGTEERVRDKNSLKGNLLKYNETTNVLKGDGVLNLGADFGFINTLAIGTIENDINKDQYLTNLTIGLDFNTQNKAINEKFEGLMYNDNIDLNDIDYSTSKFKLVWDNIIDKKADEKIIKEFEATGIPKRPKALPHYLVFTDVNMIYDKTDMTLRSYGKIGVSFIGERGIHKKIDGYIEIGYRQNADFCNIYLKTGANEWFFIEYKPGMLGMVSSYDEFVRTIGGVAPDKRKVEGPNNRFYVYTIGSTINKQTFLDAMKEKANPNLPTEKVFKRKVTDSTAVKNTTTVKDTTTKTNTPIVKDSTTNVKAASPKTENPQQIPNVAPLPADTTSKDNAAPQNSPPSKTDAPKEEPKAETPKDKPLPPAVEEFNKKKEKEKKKKGKEKDDLEDM